MKGKERETEKEREKDQGNYWSGRHSEISGMLCITGHFQRGCLKLLCVSRRQGRENNESWSTGFQCPGSKFRTRGIKSPTLPLVYVWGHSRTFGIAGKAMYYQVIRKSDTRDQGQPWKGSAWPRRPGSTMIWPFPTKVARDLNRPPLCGLQECSWGHLPGRSPVTMSRWPHGLKWGWWQLLPAEDSPPGHLPYPSLELINPLFMSTLFFTWGYKHLTQ